MDISVFPTDNLYKFMALSGLGLVIFCITLMVTVLRRLREKVEQTEMRVDLLKAEGKQIGDDIALIEKNPSQSREQLAELRQWTRRVDLKNAKVAVYVSRARRALNEAKATGIWLAFGTLIGLGLASAGFFLWYDRLQRFQDAAVRLGR